MTPEKLGAFIEYVCRPLIEDIRLILDRLEKLKLPIDRKLIEDVFVSLVYLHIFVIVVQFLTAIGLGLIVCHAAIRILQ